MQAAKPVLSCVSCGRYVESEAKWVAFKCPQCGKADILRCGKCKTVENQYECAECGFIGP